MSVQSQNSELHFSIPVNRAMQRFRELIVYVSSLCADDPFFGAIKLNKILYYSDFRAFEKFGIPLTGMRYFKLPQGPAPKALLPVQRELLAEGAIRLDFVQFGEYEQRRTVALRKPVLEHFTADELELVDDVVKELWHQNASEVSNASHDIRWRVLQMRDEMPYEFAYLSNESMTAAEIVRTNELANQLGWQRS